jgi:ketosteroid isomerase-like protein
MDQKKRKEIESEIRQAFDAYELALTTNDVAAVIDLFWNDHNTVRLGPDGGLYGFEEISNFRKGRPADDLDRHLTKVQIYALTESIGIANAEYRRKKSGRRGAQSHVWLKRDGTWRIISAHVSLSS